MSGQNKMDAILDLLIEQASEELIEEPMNHVPELEDIEFSKEHVRKMKKLFGRERRKLHLKKVTVFSQRAAVVALVIVLLSGVTVFSVDAFRDKFWNFVKEITNTSIKIGDNAPEGDVYTAESITFGYIPKEFVLVNDEKRIDGICFEFMLNDDFFVFYLKNGMGEMTIDTEGATTSNVNINGHEAFCSVNDNGNILVWNDGIYVYTLVGNIEQKELVRIAEKIKRTVN